MMLLHPSPVEAALARVYRLAENQDSVSQCHEHKNDTWIAYADGKTADGKTLAQALDHLADRMERERA